MNWLDLLLWGGGFFLLSPFILGVPLVKKTHWIARRCTLRPLSPSERPEISDWLAQQHSAIEAEGFRYLGDFVMEKFTSQVTTYFAFYQHAETGLAAISAWVDSPMQAIRFEEIFQLFAEQRELAVSNCSIAPSWISEGKEVHRFPWLEAFRELLALHRFIRSLNPLYSEAQALAEGEEINFLQRYFDNESEQAVKAGIYHAGNNPQHWELTWPGSIYMVWNNAFPGKQLNAWQELAQSRKLERRARRQGFL